MTKEEIEDELLCFSEEDDDWDKVVKAFNLGLEIAAENATASIKKGFDIATGTFDGFEASINKESILKLKIK